MTSNLAALERSVTEMKNRFFDEKPAIPSYTLAPSRPYDGSLGMRSYRADQLPVAEMIHDIVEACIVAPALAVIPSVMREADVATIRADLAQQARRNRGELRTVARDHAAASVALAIIDEVVAELIADVHGELASVRHLADHLSKIMVLDAVSNVCGTPAMDLFGLFAEMKASKERQGSSFGGRESLANLMPEPRNTLQATATARPMTMRAAAATAKGGTAKGGAATASLRTGGGGIGSRRDGRPAEEARELIAAAPVQTAPPQTTEQLQMAALEADYWRYEAMRYADDDNNNRYHIIKKNIL